LKTLKIIEKVAETTAPGPSLTFTETHVMKAVELIGERGTVGRVKLAEELGIGEGAVRTLIRHLGDAGLTINSKSGCKLTKLGKQVFVHIKSRVGGPVEVPRNPITVGTYNVAMLVRKAAGVVRYGVEQRDAAVKLGASGATTLIFKNNVPVMPGVEENCFRDAPEIQRLLTSKLLPEENDVIIIGSADSRIKAELSAKAAALETLKLLGKQSAS